MAICKFFLQGTCRFGNSCKFDHQLNTEHSYGASILLRNTGYPPQNETTSRPAQQPHIGATVDTNTLIKSVSNDMISAEKGGQWILSTYAPFKDKAVFPGFEDYSMEEIRFMYYEAVQNGTVDQMKRGLQELLQQAAVRVKALQNPSQDIVNILKSIYHDGKTTATSIFGEAMQSSNNNAFGGSPNVNVFGNSTAQTQPTSNIFQQQPAQNRGSIFMQSNQQASSTNSSLFQRSTQNNQNFTAVFQQPNSTANTSSMFSQSIPPQSTNVQPLSIFQQQPDFNQQPAGVVKGSMYQQLPQTKPSSIFGSNAQQTTPSIFGKTNNQFGAISQNTAVNEDFYTKRSDLDQRDIEWYEAIDLDLIDINMIPNKPPTYEMCFGNVN